MSDINRTKHIPKFGGNIWYVSKGGGNDANSGKTPDQAFETIGAAITALADGDAITIMAGVYTEVGLDLDHDNCEMWFEIGSILRPASGTALLISGSYCWAGCHDGALLVDPAGANTTAVQVTGNFVYLEDIRAKCDSVADTGFDLQGNGADLRLCRCSNPLEAAFEISGDTVKIEDCCTGGTPADTSIGYWVKNGADKTRLKNCGSQGNGTSGFQLDTGVTNAVLKDCSSGGGDGRWSDADDAGVWSDFTYDDQVYHATDWSVVGGAAGTDNIFQITGSVNVLFIYGDVETQMHADVDDIYLELDDGANQVNVTGQVGGGTDTNSAEVGSVFMKTEIAANNIALNQANQVRLNEDAAGRKGLASFIVTQKSGTNTYIRAGWTGTGATGVIHWHCQWEPLTEDGFVVGV